MILALGATLLNPVLSRWLKVWHWSPDLPVVGLSYLGLVAGPGVASVVGLLQGIYQDMYAPSLLGSHALAKTLVGTLAGSLGQKLQVERLVIQFPGILLLCFLHQAVLAFASGMPGAGSFLLYHAAGSALYSALVGCVAVRLAGDWLMPGRWVSSAAGGWKRVR